MKIVKVECFPVTLVYHRPHALAGSTGTAAHSVAVKFHTDDGVVGVADTGGIWEWYLGESQDGIMSLICDLIAPQFLLGKDPFRIDQINADITAVLRGASQTKAVVDFALHDLKGKALNLPAYELLGGKSNDTIPCGYVLAADTRENMIRQAKEVFDAGFESVKLKIGVDSVKNEIEMIAAIREGVGRDKNIMVDANGGLNYSQALELVRNIEEYNIMMLEQPLHWRDFEGMARLRGKTGIPIFPDESAMELMDVLELINRGCADGIFLKVVKAGGITKAMKFIHIAEAAGMSVICGCMVGGTLEAAAQAHVLAASSWTGKNEHENIGPLVVLDAYSTNGVSAKGNDITTELPLYDNGHLMVSDKPGLGFEIDDEALETAITAGKSPRAVEL